MVSNRAPQLPIKRFNPNLSSCKNYFFKVDYGNGKTKQLNIFVIILFFYFLAKISKERDLKLSKIESWVML